MGEVIVLPVETFEKLYDDQVRPPAGARLAHEQAGIYPFEFRIGEDTFVSQAKIDLGNELDGLPPCPQEE